MNATTNETKNYYIVSSSAHMPNKCWGIYRHVAIIERNDGKRPTIIRDTKSQKIIATWRNLNVGRTEKCAYRRALKEAEAYLASLR